MMARSNHVAAHATSLTHRRWISAVFGLLVVLAATQTNLGAQPDSSSAGSLRQRIEERFDVLVSPNAVSLRPSTPIPDVTWVEILGDSITIDGEVVTGVELRDRLGDDADLVIQLSYRDPDARRALFESAPAPEAPPATVDAADRPSRRDRPRGRRSENRVRIGGGVTVDVDEVVAGDVVAIGGSVVVNGEVNGDVVAVGGSLELGPNALVTGDAVVVGGALRRDPTAEVLGEVQEVGVGMIDFGDWRPRLFGPWWEAGMSSMFRLMATLVRIGVLCLLVGLVMLVARDQVALIGQRAAAEPVKAGVIGVLSQLLFVPLLVVTVIVLIVTIIGIPLLLLIPFAILGLAVVGLVGFTSIAHYVGGLVNVRFGWTERGALATALLGVAVIVAPLVLARCVALAGGFVFPMTFGLSFLGSVVEYLAWTVGFGAVALSRFSAVPPLPSVPVASQGPA